MNCDDDKVPIEEMKRLFLGPTKTTLSDLPDDDLLKVLVQADKKRINDSVILTIRYLYPPKWDVHCESAMRATCKHADVCKCRLPKPSVVCAGLLARQKYRREHKEFVQRCERERKENNDKLQKWVDSVALNQRPSETAYHPHGLPVRAPAAYIGLNFVAV